MKHEVFVELAGGKRLSFETGNLAKQAHGAAVVRMGDNVVLAQQEGKKLIMVMSGLNKLFINWAMHKDVAKSKGVTESMPLADKIKALKGLTVGVTNPGALTAHLAAFVIRKAGYNPQQDVNIVPIGSGPTWLAALENRKVDVALTAPPVPGS